MENDHITMLLEERAIGELSDSELTRVDSHVAGCADCRRAYASAQVAQSLLQARAAEQVDVSPFFRTRVMAALRERKLSAEQPALVRMWKAAGALISMMAALVVLLVGLTVFTSGSGSPALLPTQIAASDDGIYSPEYVVLDAGDSSDDPIPVDQIFNTVYDSESDDGN